MSIDRSQAIGDEELPLPLLTRLLQRMSVRLTTAPPAMTLNRDYGAASGAGHDARVVDEEDAEDYER